MTRPATWGAVHDEIVSLPRRAIELLQPSKSAELPGPAPFGAELLPPLPPRLAQEVGPADPAAACKEAFVEEARRRWRVEARARASCGSTDSSRPDVPER